MIVNNEKLYLLFQKTKIKSYVYHQKSKPHFSIFILLQFIVSLRENVGT